MGVIERAKPSAEFSRGQVGFDGALESHVGIIDEEGRVEVAGLERQTNSGPDGSDTTCLRHPSRGLTWRHGGYSSGRMRRRNPPISCIENQPPIFGTRDQRSGVAAKERPRDQDGGHDKALRSAFRGVKVKLRRVQQPIISS